MPLRRGVKQSSYARDSLTLWGTVAMGTGVMIGAALFALVGQVAELAGAWFPLAFLLAAIVSGFSAYSYVKMSNAFPSAGGIAMYLEKAYGKGTVTGAAALLMAISMIISESLVARTFGTYTLQLFSIPDSSILVPALGVALIVLAFVVNLAGNRVVESLQLVTATVKIGGIAIFAVASLWAAGFAFQPTATGVQSPVTGGGFLAGTALAILAYKGFTTITNSGGEVVDPHRNVGRAIVISLLICLVLYLLVAFAVGANLSVPEIIEARNYAMAEAARPALGAYGAWFTIGIVIVATVSGIIASLFAVSRMLTMLTEMKIIPHSHLGMSGDIHRHLLVYSGGLAIVLTAFFDLSRIASLGAIFYLVMDVVVHWGVLRRMGGQVSANPAIVGTAIVLDLVVLFAFITLKLGTDPTIVWLALGAIATVVGVEKFFLSVRRRIA